MTDSTNPTNPTLEGNVAKVQSISTRLMVLIAEEYEGERPDLVLLGVIDTAVKVVRLFNAEGTTVEALDALMVVVKQMRDGEAAAIPCNQEGCTNSATHSYVWPTDGATKHSCAIHTQKAVQVGHVLGYEIRATPLLKLPELELEEMGG